MLHIALLTASFCVTATGPAVPDDTLQLVVGIAPDWHSRVADLYRFERKPGGVWKRVGPRVRANTGKNGLAAGRGLIDWCGPDDDRKVEGDKKAPAGAFRIGRSYGFGDGLRRLPHGKLTPITREMVCVSDPASRSYNRVVDPSKVDVDWDWARPLRKPHGVMSRMVFIDLNGGDDPDAPAPEPNAGSCVLFHVSRGRNHPTVGCTSMPAPAMDRLLSWLEPASKPVYVLMTAKQYRELAARPGSGLPAVN